MVESVDAAGLPSTLRPVDYLMYRREANPRYSGYMGIFLFDTTPDWRRFRARFDDISRKALRLRQKVVAPTLPTAAPRWVVDPDFDLDFHVRRARVLESAALREVFDLAEAMLQSPLDVSRPLWTVTLVEGLAGHRAAMLLRISHAVADGVGGVSMFAQLYDRERDPPAEPSPPHPIPQNLSPNDLMWEGIKRLPGATVRAVWRALWVAMSTVSGSLLNPRSALTGVVGYGRSGVRVMKQPTEKSPLLRQRGLFSRSEALDIRLSDLHKAAKACGGSINDAYLAGLCAALGRYHQALGVPIDTLPMWVPVNVRTQADPAGGNRFAGVALTAPVGTADPVDRMRQVRVQMMQHREEPARDIGGFIMPLLSVLPAFVVESITPSESPWDAVATNVRSHKGDTYLAGAKVLRQYAFSSRSGSAMLATLISRAGWCTVTVRYDTAAVRDERLFAQCLVEGFDEILALAGEPAPRAMPASFALDRDGDEVPKEITGSS